MFWTPRNISSAYSPGSTLESRPIASSAWTSVDHSISLHRVRDSGQSFWTFPRPKHAALTSSLPGSPLNLEGTTVELVDLHMHFFTSSQSFPRSWAAGQYGHAQACDGPRAPRAYLSISRVGVWTSSLSTLPHFCAILSRFRTPFRASQRGLGSRFESRFLHSYWQEQEIHPKSTSGLSHRASCLQACPHRRLNFSQ